MPDRRPYASRGVPRRATTRWSDNQSSTGKITLVLGIVIALAGAAAWWAFPFSESASEVIWSPQPRSAAPDQALRRVVTPGPVVATPDVQNTTVQDNRQATEPTLRQWEAQVAGIASDAALISRLDRALVGVDGRIGVAVKDLGSGRGAVLDGDLELQSASLYKLTVLYSVFASGIGLYEELPITYEALSYDTGSMELGPGETLSVAEALERMVTLSDNASAIMLGGRVGASRIISNISALGMDTTHYSLDRMTTSPLDMLHLLELAADGKAVSPAAS